MDFQCWNEFFILSWYLGECWIICMLLNTRRFLYLWDLFFYVREPITTILDYCFSFTDSITSFRGFWAWSAQLNCSLHLQYWADTSKKYRSWLRFEVKSLAFGKPSKQGTSRIQVLIGVADSIFGRNYFLYPSWNLRPRQWWVDSCCEPWLSSSVLSL